jgi:hypothetical protein
MSFRHPKRGLRRVYQTRQLHYHNVTESTEDVCVWPGNRLGPDGPKHLFRVLNELEEIIYIRELRLLRSSIR